MFSSLSSLEIDLLDATHVCNDLTHALCYLMGSPCLRSCDRIDNDDDDDDQFYESREYIRRPRPRRRLAVIDRDDDQFYNAREYTRRPAVIDRQDLDDIRSLAARGNTATTAITRITETTIRSTSYATTARGRAF